MNRLEQFLSEIRELSDTGSINDSHEMQSRLDEINELTVEFYDSMYQLDELDDMFEED